MNTASQKSDTLFAGRVAAVLHEDGTHEGIQIRQLRLMDYEKAFQHLGDEFAFTAFCCLPGDVASPLSAVAPKTKDWIETLQPESYELLQASVREVNEKGFFSYAARRQARAEQEQKRLIEQMAGLPPETLKIAAEIGKSTSPTSLPRPRPN